MSSFVRHCELGTKKCRECLRKAKREYMARERAKDPEKFLSRSREQYRSRPEVRVRVKAQARAWGKAHPFAKQIDRLNYARRASAAPGKHSHTDITAQLNAQESCCFYCGKMLIVDCKVSFHIEHKIPLARGGTNWPENIVCACAVCNLRKGKRTAEEFFEAIRSEQVANDRAA